MKRITKPINQLAEKYHEIQHEAGKTARDMCEATETFVHDNPWWSLGMVAVTALVVGLLLGQSISKS